MRDLGDKSRSGLDALLQIDRFDLEEAFRAMRLRVDDLDQDGIVLTHGNHPDSLQLGIESGRLWIGIAGEKEYCSLDIAAGRWYEVAVALDAHRVALYLDGGEAAAATHWSKSSRWKALSEGASALIADSLPHFTGYALILEAILVSLERCWPKKERPE